MQDHQRPLLPAPSRPSIASESAACGRERRGRRSTPLALLVGLSALALIAASPVQAPFGGLPTAYGYAELADMALTAPIVLSADIAQATALKGEAAADVAPGRTRWLIAADIRGLIAGKAQLPPQIRYLVDLPSPAGGAKPKLKGVGVLLLAAPSPRPGEVQLVGPRAQVPRTPENEARLRAILTAAIAPDAPPAIQGIARAFHVAGSLPGEGETQIFLRTADNRPISLNVLRRPGETPRWAVSLTELVDASAAPPQRDSFLWYRLACGLPRALPASATSGLADEDARLALDDYRVVLDGLGACSPAG